MESSRVSRYSQPPWGDASAVRNLATRTESLSRSERSHSIIITSALMKDRQTVVRSGGLSGGNKYLPDCPPERITDAACNAGPMSKVDRKRRTKFM